MRPIASVFLVYMLLFAGCSDVADQNIASSQVERDGGSLVERQRRLVDKANRGDEAALKELQQFYFEARDTTNYYHWVKREADLGKPDAMQRLALLLSMQGGKENCEKAEQLLLSAVGKQPSRAVQNAIELDLRVLRGEVKDVPACK